MFVSPCIVWGHAFVRQCLRALTPAKGVLTHTSDAAVTALGFEKSAPQRRLRQDEDAAYLRYGGKILVHDFTLRRRQ